MISNSKLICIFFYHFFVVFFHFLADIYSTAMKMYKKGKDCEILKILYHYPTIKLDLTRIKLNFLWIHDRFETNDILVDSHWVLYSLDCTYVYFTKLPQKIECYNAKEAPFLYQSQTDSAVELARMTHQQFFNFASQIGAPCGPVVYFCNAARSGSTLVAQMLQVSNNVVMAEPAFFTLLPILYLYEKKIDKQTYEKLLCSSFNVLCKNQAPQQLYIMKTRSNGVRLLRDVLTLMPEVKTMFLWRRTGTRVVQSVARMLISVFASDRYIPLLTCPPLAHWLVGFSKVDGDWIEKMKPKDSLELAYLYYALSYAEYFHNKDKGDIVYVEFEDITGSTSRQETEVVFDNLGIPRAYLSEAMSCLNQDSQAGTVLSQTKQTNVQVVVKEFSEEKKKRFNEIDEMLGLKNEKFWI